MEFALLLKNAGEGVRWYDAQGLSHNTISVKDSAGKEVHCKIGSHQTGGSESPLDKGEIDILFSKRDLAADYVIAKPGTYTVQFRGGSYGMGGKDSELPPSNVVKMEVKDGQPLVFDTILLKLEGVVPSERWQVSGYHDHRTAVDTKFIVSRSPESRLKRDVLRAEVWIAPKSLEGDKSLEGSNAEYLGRHKQNYVYAVIPEATEAVWPTAGADIRKALDL
jgi:hypothetical protein